MEPVDIRKDLEHKIYDVYSEMRENVSEMRRATKSAFGKCLTRTKGPVDGPNFLQFPANQ